MTTATHTPAHTPGPWHVVLSDNATPHIMHEGGSDWTDIEDRSSLVCSMPAEIMLAYNAFANACLIAAAPELLAALQNLVGEWPEGEGMALGARIKQAHAAIAKALGAAS